MKVIALNGSRRKQYTYGLLSSIANILTENNIEVEIINLFDYNIQECIGCERCILKDKCVLKDDLSVIMDKILESDGVILGSPVYMENISGKMKTFIDRTCKWFHRPEIYGKPVLAVVTTKGSGSTEASRYLNNVAVLWGGINAGRIRRCMINIEEPATIKECQKFIKILKEPTKYSPSIIDVVQFQTKKLLAYNTVEADKIYWQQKQWYDKPYYIKCKVKIVYKCINNLAYRYCVRLKRKSDQDGK